jgi:hypothetical protein
LYALDVKSATMINRYIRLVQHALSTDMAGYTERHHIVPKSMGGSDDQSNIVRLTPRLHYVAHYILWKAYRNRKMSYAFHVMIHGNPYGKRYKSITSKTYEILMKECKEHNRGENHPAYGIKRTEESKVNQRNAVKGKKWTDDRKKKLSESLKSFYKDNGTRSLSDETKKRISDANKGRSNPFSEEHKAALHVHTLNTKQLTCPRCNKVGQFSNMKRWHMDNCKSIPKAAEKNPE